MHRVARMRVPFTVDSATQISVVDLTVCWTAPDAAEPTAHPGALRHGRGLCVSPIVCLNPRGCRASPPAFGSLTSRDATCGRPHLPLTEVSMNCRLLTGAVVLLVLVSGGVAR